MGRPTTPSTLAAVLGYMLATGAPWPALLAWWRTRLRKRGTRQFDQAAITEAEDVARHTGTFGPDWFSHVVPHWLRAFEVLGGPAQPLDVLEIGSWEGRSACYLLRKLPQARLTVVDTWGGSDEMLRAREERARVAEQRFDQNTRLWAARVTKHKMASDAFFQARPPGPQFDLVYVDGSHHADDVMRDALSAFAALRPGGVLIFDDYLWRFYPRPVQNPAGAINAFLRLKAGEFDYLAVDYQVLLRKKAQDASAPA